MLASARGWVAELDDSILPIQGPPGAGKTYTGARMITSLVRAGRKVGVTALSHKVIRNLLNEVVKAAEQEHTEAPCVQKVTETLGEAHTSIVEIKDNAAILGEIQSGAARVAAGTTWLWSREDFFESVDVLFVDEAGQLTLADVLAVSQAAKNLVLLGDPQQLGQPLQGSHPEGTAVSALEHLLDGHKTILPELGLFLDHTWRLHPHICAFTSELFYEGRLTSRPNLDRQVLDGPTPFAGAGLWFVPVLHEGNQSSSPEEVEQVVELVAGLTAGGVHWTDQANDRSVFRLSDILIIAPLKSRLPAADRDSRQIPRSGGARGHLLADHIVTRRSHTRNGISVQPQSTERRRLSRQGSLYRGWQPGAVRARIPEPSAGAPCQCLLPLPGDGTNCLSLFGSAPNVKVLRPRPIDRRAHAAARASPPSSAPSARTATDSMARSMLGWLSSSLSRRCQRA
jgi:hypothetical protein